MQHLQKLISTFHKDYPEKLIVPSSLIDIAALIARPTSKPTTKQKEGQSAGANKRAQKS